VTRAGNYICTFTGRKFWPLDPSPDDVDVQDIAHALSNMCRWTGHIREFYSVAQHACMVADLVSSFGKQHALAGLHHDSAEAYLSDICSPTKQFLYCRYQLRDLLVTKSFEDAEARIEACVNEAFEIFTPLIVREEVKKADRLALRWEAHHFMTLPADDPIHAIPLIEAYRTTPWSPAEAKHQFLARHTAFSTRGQS
jgi:5'-deoxynucleotidase YfbR-like HD superfamily hydrolase